MTALCNSLEINQIMSERTAGNQKFELTMTIFMVVVIAMLAVPLAISLFKNVPVVSFLLVATPFVLIAIGVATLVSARKKEG